MASVHQCVIVMIIERARICKKWTNRTQSFITNTRNLWEKNHTNNLSLAEENGHITLLYLLAFLGFFSVTKYCSWAFYPRAEVWSKYSIWHPLKTLPVSIMNATYGHSEFHLDLSAQCSQQESACRIWGTLHTSHTSFIHNSWSQNGHEGNF